MRSAFANAALAKILFSSVRTSVADIAPTESAIPSFCRELRSGRRFVRCNSGLGSLLFPYKNQLQTNASGKTDSVTFWQSEYARVLEQYKLRTTRWAAGRRDRMH